MKLTIEQTDKVLKKLRDYGVLVIDAEDSTITKGLRYIDEEYFNEKVNEALEDEPTIDIEDLSDENLKQEYEIVRRDLERRNIEQGLPILYASY